MPPAPPNLPDDKDTLKVLVAALIRERDDLQIENLRLQVELDSYKKRYYGPRADRLQSAGDLAQLLLSFSQELDRKPIDSDDVPPHSEPTEELRRVKLTAVGIYGVTSYSVVQRQKEIGIRMALGTGPSSVTSMVIREGAMLAGVGILIGVGAALAGSHLISTFLFWRRAARSRHLL